MKVSEDGGVPALATQLAKGEEYHSRPHFLPGGRQFLYRASGPGECCYTFYVATLDSTGRTPVPIESGQAAYSQGHLLFARQGTLVAQPFDTERLALTDTPLTVAEGLLMNAYGVFSASKNGVLTYLAGSTTSRLLWFDRAGKEVDVLADAGPYDHSLTISPDGMRAAVVSHDPGPQDEIWIFDLARKVKTRLTFNAANDLSPVWSPDGARLIFTSNRTRPVQLFQKELTGGAAAQIVLDHEGYRKTPYSWSSDGRFILYSDATHVGDSLLGDLWTLSLTDRRSSVFLRTPYQEADAQFSPDGRWVAYQSNESGEMAIYVAPFPGPGAKERVSTTGGVSPRWRRDGKELFYYSSDEKVMATAMNTVGMTVSVGSTTALFKARIGAYDVTADGEKFLIRTPQEVVSGATKSMTVILNWTAAVTR